MKRFAYKHILKFSAFSLIIHFMENFPITIQQKCFTYKRIKTNFMQVNSTMQFMNTDMMQHKP